jgi:Zn ribbon nucleic-acid-binding protein
MSAATTVANCPTCYGHDCVQIDYQKAECLDCGEVFIHQAPELDEEVAHDVR